MALHGKFSAAIDPVALMLEAAQYDDEALGSAWRDRMHFRHQVHRKIVQRIADLFYAVTLPGPWRELASRLAGCLHNFGTGRERLRPAKLKVSFPTFRWVSG